MSAEVIEKGFGRYLQDRRKSKGVSLEVVSHQTKITPSILRQIENEDLNQLPAPVFIKGFIKAFAKAVGANAQEAVLRFENYLDCRDRSCSIPTTPPKRTFNKLGLSLAMALFIATIGATLYLAHWMQSPSIPSPTLPKVASDTTQSDASESSQISGTKIASQTAPEKVMKSAPETVPESAPDAVPESAPETVPEAAPEAVAEIIHEATPPTPVVTLGQEKPIPLDALASPVDALAPHSDGEAEAPGLSLRVTAVEATWFKVVSDDQSPKEYLLQEDEDVTLVARNGFDLVIGNAAGIRLMLNDQPVPVVGKRGQVVDIHLP